MVEIILYILSVALFVLNGANKSLTFIPDITTFYDPWSGLLEALCPITTKNGTDWM